MADQSSGCIADNEHDPVGDHLYLTGWTDLRGGEDMTREDLERIADELEEVINSSVFDPYGREEDAIRKAVDELRWKAEEME